MEDFFKRLESSPAFVVRGSTFELVCPINLDDITFTIGCDNRCAVHIRHDADRDIAPLHAIVFTSNGKWYVQSLLPEATVRVNNEPIIRATEITPRDIIRFGKQITGHLQLPTA